MESARLRIAVYIYRPLSAFLGTSITFSSWFYTDHARVIEPSRDMVTLGDTLAESADSSPASSVSEY